MMHPFYPRRRDLRSLGRATGSALLAAIVLSGCSSVPDAVNPVEWYHGASDALWGTSPKDKGKSKAASKDAKSADVGKGSAAKDAPDFPKLSSTPDTPKPLSPEDRKDITKGLVADRSRAKYTDDVIKREGTPTRALNTAQAKPAEPAAGVPAAPKVVAEQMPAPKPTQASVAAPAPVAVAQTAAPLPAPSANVQDWYQRRLAESASQQVTAQTGGIVASAGDAAPATVVVGANSYAPAPQLVAPGAPRGREARRGRAEALHSLDEFDQSGTGASFQVATVGFGGGAALTGADVAALRDVVRLYKLQGGTIRVVGHAVSRSPNRDAVRDMLDTFDVSMKRANAVAQELRKLGVPAGALYVGAKPDQDPAYYDVASNVARDRGAEVYLDY